MIWLFKLLGRLPLRFMHGLGAGLGWLAYWISATYARRLRDNLARSGIAADDAAFRRLLRATISEAGKGLLELFVVWGRSPARALALVRACDGWEHVEAARASGRGVIVLTPHLGCFEIVGLYCASRLPMTVLYRPPRLRWLQPLMEAGRATMTLAPTDISGVRKLLSALKRGEAIGVLPDQVPGSGEGVWAPFFGRPAYTMTLLGKLVERTQAQAIMVFAERLDKGRGYRLSFTPMPQPVGAAGEAARIMNAAVEAAVRLRPEQYLWSYNRYKTPRGAPSPEEATKQADQ
jgi:KDO2-lipid IV(A) lauroyltransferase